MNRTPSGFVACVALSLHMTSPAQAYCRATTCDPIKDNCPVDSDGCPLIGPDVGLPLYWPTLCVSYAVQQIGSPRRGVSSKAANSTLGRAFQSWISADCGNGERPSLGIIPFGLVQCDEAEFNPPDAERGGAPNANILIFQDTQWPYGAEAIDVARTTLTFDTATGAIFDADIEVNSFANLLSLPGDDITQDLQAILTHETGHFLGLAHSLARASSMNAQYALNDLAYRTLSDDDIRGICDLYPPQGEFTCSADAAPTNGFASTCQQGEERPFETANASCLSVAGSPMPSHDMKASWWLAALSIIVASRQRRFWHK